MRSWSRLAAISNPATGIMARGTASSVCAWGPCSRWPSSSSPWASPRSRFCWRAISTRRGPAGLYLRRHDRINNWDLVDLGAHQVLGAWLLDRDRHVLYALARSDNLWERRSAMFATFAFVRKGQLDDAMAIAEILVADPHDLIHKVVGGMLREVATRDRPRVEDFLERHAATMPRVMLRYSIEHFSPEDRADWLGRGA